MSKTVERARRLVLGLALGLGLASCPGSGANGATNDFPGYAFWVVNESGRTLFSYPVVTDPPPPHREADPTGDVPPGEARRLHAPGGFNPAYANMFFALEQANGFHAGFALEEPLPAVLVQVFHYRKAPGTEGTAPANQPQKLFESFFEVSPGDWTLTVPTDFQVTLTPGSPP